MDTPASFLWRQETAILPLLSVETGKSEYEIPVSDFFTGVCLKL